MPIEVMVFTTLASVLAFGFVWIGTDGGRSLRDENAPAEIALATVLVLYSLWGLSFLWRF